MLKSMWRRVNQWLSSDINNRRPMRRYNPTPLRVEVLEDRVTPSAFTADIVGTTLKIAKVGSGNSNLTIVNSGGFQGFTVGSTFGDTINGLSSITTPNGITAIVVNEGFGIDTLTLDGTTATGIINLSGGLSITGTGGDKTITAKSVNLINKPQAGVILANPNALKIALTGSGTETATFTDVNVTGPALVTHLGVGNTSFTINTTATNTTKLNNWGSLSITNGTATTGTGSDINTVTDTIFSGSVTIANGKGASGNASQYGGSRNTFSANNYTTLLTIGGSLNISTATGQSDTQVFDYNIHGNLAIGAGKGIPGQSTANFIGIENDQTVAASGIPILGSVTVTGGSVANLNPGLSIDIGTDNVGTDFFLRIVGTLSITATGNGSATIDLNDLTVGGTSSIALGSLSSNNTVNVQGDNVISSYAGMTITSSALNINTFNIQTIQGTTDFSAGLAFKLATGADAITIGAATGVVNVRTTLGLTSTGGNKNLIALNSVFGGLSFAGTGVGAQTSLFTDVNVTGAAIASHAATGDTSFTINTSNTNTNHVNYWNSLSITNGRGADTNTIHDTMFSGSVTINNGLGAFNNTSQFGGSQTVLSAEKYQTLLSVSGNVTIITSTGQSDSQVFDYNVHGNVAVTSGAGILNQTVANFIGVEADQTVANSGIPVIGGSLTMTGTPVKTLATGVTIDAGIDASNNHFPLIIHGNLTVTANGTGAASINLNDLNVANGTTTITLAKTTSNNTVSVQGSTVTAVFWNFIINSFALGNNTFNVQNQAGKTQFIGTVKVKLGSGNDVVNVAAVANAIVEFYSTSLFDGGLLGVDTFFGGTGGTNVFFNIVPVVINF